MLSTSLSYFGEVLSRFRPWFDPSFRRFIVTRSIFPFGWLLSKVVEFQLEDIQALWSVSIWGLWDTHRLVDWRFVEGIHLEGSNPRAG